MLAGPEPGWAKPGTRHVAAGKSHAAKKHAAKPRRAAKQRRSHRRTAEKPAASKAAPLRAAILMDAETGAVLRETNPDMPAFPASLTKMMTLYLAFSELREGRLGLEQRLQVSAHAERQEPSKLWLKVGDSVRVRSLILALVTRSANDAAVVLAEGIAGSEAAFAERMTETAKRLGMQRTEFRNASGLPDPEQKTTARDIARLALALQRDFPRRFDYFSVREFEFRGKKITGHNHLLESYDGSDGIKTGYTRAAGFNLAASAERNGHRLIGVILGSPSWRVRDRQMAALLDRGFARLRTAPTAAEDTLIAAAKPAGLIARLAAHTSPIGTAAAAAVRKPPLRPAAADASRALQLGAFRARAAARELARSASRLAPVKGKDVSVRKISADGKKSLYAVQVSDFTAQAAKVACADLKKSKLPCVVVPAPDEG